MTAGTTASYRITEGDYVGAGKLALQFQYKLLILLTAIVFIILPSIEPVVLPAAAGTALGLEAIVRHFASLVIPAAVWLVVFILGMRHIGFPYVWRRNYRKTKGIQDEIQVSLSDKGVQFKYASGESRLTWDRILQWRKNERYILLYPAPNCYHIIPKAGAAGGFDFALLESRLEQHIGKPV
jgi:hypothetical protein